MSPWRKHVAVSFLAYLSKRLLTKKIYFSSSELKYLASVAGSPMRVVAKHEQRKNNSFPLLMCSLINFLVVIIMLVKHTEFVPTTISRLASINIANY